MLLLDIGDVGAGRVESCSEEVELQWLFFNLGLGVGGSLWLEEVLDLVHGLPWLSALLSGGGGAGVVGGGRLEFVSYVLDMSLNV